MTRSDTQAYTSTLQQYRPDGDNSNKCRYRLPDRVVTRINLSPTRVPKQDVNFVFCRPAPLQSFDLLHLQARSLPFHPQSTETPPSGSRFLADFWT